MKKIVMSILLLSMIVTGVAFAVKSGAMKKAHHHAVRVHASTAKQVKLNHRLASPLNINRASARELVMLKGLGPKKAQAIIAYRQSKGRFQAVSDLTKVKGIGNKFLVRLLKQNPGKVMVKKT